MSADIADQGDFLMERRGFTITKFGQHSDGYLHARVTPAEGRAIYVHRKSGSWMAPGTSNGKAVLKEVLPHVAVELQKKAREWERANRPLPIPQMFEIDDQMFESEEN